MSQRFKVHDGAYPHFITNTVIHWIPVFCRDDYFQVMIDSFNYCISHKGLLIHSYVLMPNHFHAVCSQVDGKLSDVIRDMKRHTSTTLLNMLERDGRHSWLRAFRNPKDGVAKLWDGAFYPEQIHSSNFYEQKLRYMHNNPIRAGFVENPEDWKCSSAGFYYCDRESVVPITPLEW